jgi:hypothetical protein
LPDRASRIAAALAAGKHVLVDGAMSATADDAFDLASHARPYGRCLMAESGSSSIPGCASSRSSWQPVNPESYIAGGAPCPVAPPIPRLRSVSALPGG